VSKPRELVFVQEPEPRLPVLVRVEAVCVQARCAAEARVGCERVVRRGQVRVCVWQELWCGGRSARAGVVCEVGCFGAGRR